MTATTADILKERRLVLAEADRLFETYCMKCKLVPQHLTVDRKNPICDACTIQRRLHACGRRLDELMFELREERRRRVY